MLDESQIAWIKHGDRTQVLEIAHAESAKTMHFVYAATAIVCVTSIVGTASANSITVMNVSLAIEIIAAIVMLVLGLHVFQVSSRDPNKSYDNFHMHFTKDFATLVDLDKRDYNGLHTNDTNVPYDDSHDTPSNEDKEGTK